MIQGLHSNGSACYDRNCALIHVTPAEYNALEESEKRRLAELPELPPKWSRVPFASDAEHGTRFPQVKPVELTPEQIAQIAKAFQDFGDALRAIVAAAQPAFAAITAEIRRASEKFAEEAGKAMEGRDG